jgi:peptide deformylase
MVKSLRSQGGVGLAAPQIDVNKRLIVVECKNLDMPRLTEFDMKV